MVKRGLCIRCKAAPVDGACMCEDCTEYLRDAAHLEGVRIKKRLREIQERTRQ